MLGSSSSPMGAWWFGVSVEGTAGGAQMEMKVEMDVTLMVVEMVLPRGLGAVMGSGGVDHLTMRPKSNAKAD